MCPNTKNLAPSNASWEKPVTKDHTLYDSIHMKRPEEGHLQRQNVDRGGLDWSGGCGGTGEGWGMIIKGSGVFRGNASVLNLIVVMGAQVCEYTRLHSVVRFTRRDWTPCELHSSRTVSKNRQFSLEHQSLGERRGWRRRLSPEPGAGYGGDSGRMSAEPRSYEWNHTVCVGGCGKSSNCRTRTNETDVAREEVIDAEF